MTGPAEFPSGNSFGAGTPFDIVTFQQLSERGSHGFRCSIFHLPFGFVCLHLIHTFPLVATVLVGALVVR